MNIFKYRPLLSAVGLFVLTLLGQGRLHAQAIWNNGAADGDWNNALNWDIGVPAEGTNAFIASGNTVTYNTPMVAPSFAALSNLGNLSINTSGFVISGSGNAAAFIASSTSSRIFVNAGGVLSIPSGGMTFTTNGAGVLAVGGTITLGGTMVVGVGGNSSSGGGQGFFTNDGGALTVSGLVVNNSGNNQTCRAVINGGVNNLGNIAVRRSALNPFAAPGPEGLLIYGGTVNATSIDVGASLANSYLTMYQAGGTLTNTGNFIVQQVTAGRASRFLQTGGISVSLGAPVNLRGHTANNVIVMYAIMGGTNLVEGFILGNTNGLDTTGTVRFTNAANIYIGSSGISNASPLNTKTIALNSGGVFGAQTDWTGTEPILLAGGAFNAAHLDGTPHNVTLLGVLSGSGALNKNGGGTLTLNAANTYSGNTVVNQGVLALGATGTLLNSPQIVVASGATFDVSAVSGYTLAAARTLTGTGTVAGDVAIASGGTVNPGSTAGTLTFSGSLTETGGAVNHFDLPTTPGPGNDKLVIGGDLNVSGINSLEIVGGGTPGTVHTLIQYAGNFNGTLGNFAITGASGSLSNNATTKTIALIIASSIRIPTNVVWVGNASVNDWDTVNRTNWINTGTGLLDYFVSGDDVLFDNTGTAHPLVNLVGNNAPNTLTVGASGNYTFGGAGAISGTTGLLKTNSGTLTITSTNTYTGPTTITGGVIDAATLAPGGSPSSIGASGADPANLIFDNGTLRYSGVTVATDRAATINAGGATIEVSTPGAVLTVSGALGGPGGLTKAGADNLILPNANTYAGGTVINAGTLQAGNNSALGTGNLTNNAAVLRLQGALTLSGLAEWNGNCALELSGVGAGNAALRGAWVGAGTVNIYFTSFTANQTFTIGGAGSGGGHMWDFSGTVDFNTNSGFLRINNDNSTFNFGSSNATFNVGTGDGTLNQRNGSTVTHLGALIGGPSTKLAGRGNSGTAGTTTYSIGGKNLDTTFAGEINNGSGTTAISKVGTGILTLSGASIHTGATTIESGKLQLDGSFSASPVTVIGGTLAGNGSIGGAVVVNSGGTLSPGASVGQLTMTSSLQLDFGSTNNFEIDKANGTNDSIVGLSSVSYGGDLIVVNLGGTLAAGDTFVLFSAAPGNYSGAFNSMTFPTLPTGLVWNTDNLLVDGSVRVTGPTLNVVNNGTSLDFSWTGNFKLQSQTNSLSVGLSNNWSDYPGGGSSPVNVPVNPAAPAVFFRLASP